MYRWGAFDTLDSPVIKEPQVIDELDGKQVVGVASGSSQVSGCGWWIISGVCVQRVCMILRRVYFTL